MQFIMCLREINSFHCDTLLSTNKLFPFRETFAYFVVWSCRLRNIQWVCRVDERRLYSEFQDLLLFYTSYMCCKTFYHVCFSVLSSGSTHFPIAVRRCPRELTAQINGNCWEQSVDHNGKGWLKHFQSHFLKSIAVFWAVCGLAEECPFSQ